MIIPALTFTINQIETGIFHVEFDNQRDLCQTMMRLQEFYESPDPLIRGQYFTLEEFMHHFTKPNGEFEHTKIWSGFNVPGNIVDAWYRLFSSQTERLTNKEIQVFIKLFQVVPSSGKWYLIATAKNDSKHIIKHEIAHGRFSVDTLYKNACLKLITEIDGDDKLTMTNSLLEMTYGPDFIDDEIQAYLSTSSNKEIKFWFGKLTPATKDVVKRLKILYKTKMV